MSPPGWVAGSPSSSTGASRAVSSWGSARRWRRRWRCPSQPRRRSRARSRRTAQAESFLRASRPTAAEVVLDVLSLDYHETIMAAAGHQAEARSRRTATRGRLHRRRRGLDSDRRQRRLLHDRRRVGARHRPRGLRRRRGDHRDRHLRGVRRHSGGRAEPDRRARRRRRRAGRQEPDQPVGVPGQRREPDRAARLLPHVQALAAARSLPPAAVRLRQVDPRQLRAPRALRRRPVRRGVGRRGPPRRLLPLQDGLQGARRVPELPERALERRHQLADRLRPSRASAAPSRTSGIRMTPFYQHLTGVPASAAGPTSTRSAPRRSASAPRSPATASSRS